MSEELALGTAWVTSVCSVSHVQLEEFGLRCKFFFLDGTNEQEQQQLQPQADVQNQGNSCEGHGCLLCTLLASWEQPWQCGEAYISFCSWSFLVVLVIHQASGLFKCLSTPQKPAISICRKVHHVKCNSSMLELPAGGVVGNFALPVVGLEELESPHQSSGIWKVSGWSCGCVWWYIRAPLSFSQEITPPVQPSAASAALCCLQTLRNPEEKVIWGIKGKYSSIRHRKTDSESQNF